MIGGNVSARNRWLRRIRCLSWLAFLAPLAASAAAPVVTSVVSPAFPSCLPRSGNGVVSVTLKPETGWSSVRVYFRRVGSPDFYFLEMRSDGAGNYWAVLPRPESGTTVVDIQFAVTDIEGNQTRSPLQQVNVLADCTASLSPGQEQFARNLVVGETAVLQAGEPLLGWQCTGVVSRIGVSGQMRYDDTCRSQVIAAALGAEASQNLATWIPLAAIGGGIVGGGIIYEREHETCSCYVNCGTH